MCLSLLVLDWVYTKRPYIWYKLNCRFDSIPFADADLLSIWGVTIMFLCVNSYIQMKFYLLIMNNLQVYFFNANTIWLWYCLLTVFSFELKTGLFYNLIKTIINEQKNLQSTTRQKLPNTRVYIFWQIRSIRVFNRINNSFSHCFII